MANYGRSREIKRRLEASTLRTYRVTLPHGEVDTVTAHYAFNNGPDGLIFRRIREDGSSKTYIVAMYAQGHWASFGEQS